MDSRQTNADTIEDIYLLSHIEDLLAAPAEMSFTLRGGIWVLVSKY
jgi:hypothetical protein